MASTPWSTCEISTIWRPATPPWALMSATTAFIVFSASPISGARCCELSCDRSAEIIEILMVWAVIPTVLPPPALVLPVAAPEPAGLAVHATASRHALATRAPIDAASAS